LQENKTINNQQSKVIKYKSFRFLIIIILVFPLQACLFHIESAHHGKVIDAETMEPLKDVAVILTIVGYCPGIGTGGDHKVTAIKETRTDEKGNYRFPWEFYAMPFYHFYDDTIFTYIKPGYFEKQLSHSDGADITKLFKMTHYLDFHYYKDHSRSPYELEEKSLYYRDAVSQNRTIKIISEGEKGVFEVFEGRAFTKIYSTINSRDSIGYVPENISSRIHYFYDKAAREWLTIDGRGKIVAPNVVALPEWNFFSSNATWGSPIFANNEHIFYPVEKNPIPVGLEYKKGEIKYIEPSIGDISALAGTVDSFFTIEDKGSSLCYYSNRKISKCYRGADLPESEEDNTVTNLKFKYITHSLNFGYYIITKTPTHWHVYNYFGVYSGNSFQELCTFSSDKNVTAFTADGSRLYIAFQNEGIRKYELGGPYYGKIPIKEDTEFFRNSRKVQYPDIYSLDAGRAVNDFAIYAVSGGSTIYRFSTNGTPDYKVKVEIK
jgi:hypothetical protein